MKNNSLFIVLITLISFLTLSEEVKDTQIDLLKIISELEKENKLSSFSFRQNDQNNKANDNNIFDNNTVEQIGKNNKSGEEEIKQVDLNKNNKKDLTSNFGTESKKELNSNLSNELDAEAEISLPLKDLNENSKNLPSSTYKTNYENKFKKDIEKSKNSNTILTLKNTDEKIIGSNNGIVNENEDFQGEININGQNYLAICNCSEKNRLDSETRTDESRVFQCDPKKIKITSEMPGKGISTTQLKDLIGNLDEIPYSKIEDYSFFCLDGRNKKIGIATPGGDAGEFLLGLDVYENLLVGKLLGYEEVKILLTSYLKFMKQPTFKMCTDNKAIDFIKNELGIEGFNIENPKSQIIKQVEGIIVNPDAIGDSHLKLITRYSEKYMIRKELISHFFRSFYNILWDKVSDLYTKLELTVLNGDNDESAFIEVRLEKDCLAEKIAPLIPNKAKNGSFSVFINQIDAVKIRRKQIALFFSDRMNHSLDPVDSNKMYNRLIHHGNAYLNIFGSFCAKELPFYTILLS